MGHLKVKKSKVTSKKDISDTLADVFSKNSSSENYRPKLKILNNRKKDKILNLLPITQNLTINVFLFRNLKMVF